MSSGFRWLALGKLSTQLIAWGMTFFVLRLLHPSDYGVVALSSAITLLFGMIAEFGLGSAIVQAKSVSRVQLANLFGYGLVINLLIVVLLLALAPLVLLVYADERLPMVIQVASLQFVFAAFCLLPDAKMRREMRFDLMAKIEFLLGVLTGLCTLVMAHEGYGYWSLVISPLVAAFLRTVLLNWTSGEWVAPRLSVQQTQALLKFGGFILLARIAGHFLSQADVLIAGVFLSKEAMGVYAVAMQLATMPLSKVMMVINQVAYPALSRMNREGGVRSEGLLQGGRMVSYVLFPVLWGLAVVAPFIVPLVIGPKWHEAVLPLQLVCIALPLRAVSTMVTTAVAAVGRADLELWNTVTGCIIFPALFYVGAQHGVVGLSWAWVIGTPLMVLVNLMRSGKVLGIGVLDVAAALFRPLLCAGGMYVLLFTLQVTGVFDVQRWSHLLMAVVLGAAVYSLLLMWLDRPAFLQLLSFVGIRRR